MEMVFLFVRFAPQKAYRKTHLCLTATDQKKVEKKGAKQSHNFMYAILGTGPTVGARTRGRSGKRKRGHNKIFLDYNLHADALPTPIDTHPILPHTLLMAGPVPPLLTPEHSESRSNALNTVTHVCRRSWIKRLEALAVDNGRSALVVLLL